MHFGNSKRALATAAVMGVALAGPTAFVVPAEAAPGGKPAGHGAKPGNANASGKQAGKARSGNASGNQSRSSASSGGSSQSGDGGHGRGGGRPDSPGRSASAPGHSSSSIGNGSSTGSGQGPRGSAGDSGQGSGSGAGAGQGPTAPRGGNGADPAGNNGTVKIETVPLGNGAPNNVPHVGCTFQVEWYGFDEGEDIISTVNFEAHSPTGDVGISGDSPEKVFVGGDPASGAGTDSGFDGRQTYELSFDGEPHAQQGYHVKLTIHTPGSIGADTKHKVFWVEPCRAATPSTDTDTPPDDTDVEGEQQGDDGEATSNDLEVAGVQRTAPTVTEQIPTAVNAGVQTGVALATSPLGLLLALLGSLVTGLGLLLRRRKA